ncbi:PD-(D/E)XK nuclease family protein [Alkalibacter saccharofermentans]|uniref:DNA helicase/exodeoxyribonuclease V, subunit B n=1 Tax=Alkalibacter saccharofermentans DSM 14828 TaxID=1120975 RepID=A0A1M4YNP1_9FIRM|nr:PD-(D/E)XK nuclease family protein [Alkalibacter saccharofermentans]SHF07257.1 DNA helicase/exodeoxyribonuclease V, subunit B [Alkalibacter saccharofermentans DSM 14828]
MIDIIAGKIGSGKAEKIYSQILECLENGEEDLYLIVPDQYTLEAEKELMKALKAEGLLSVDVVSFSRYMDILLDKSFQPKRTLVSSTGKKMIIRKVLKDLKEDLSAYSGMVDKSGFVDEIESTMKSLKENMIDVGVLATEGSDIGSMSMVDRKIRDIGAIYEAYSMFMDNGYLDAEERINLAIKEAARDKRVKRSKIWIHGFHTFTKQIMEFIKVLADNAIKVGVTIDINNDESEPDREIYEINRKTFQQLREMNRDNCNVEFLGHAVSKDSDIGHLQDEFFAYPYKKRTGAPRDIKIIQSQNVYNEIDNVCVDIIRMVREDDIRYKDVCVIANDLESYSFLIQRTFEEYKIPCFVDIKRSVSDKPLAIFAIAALNCIVYNFTYEDVFSMIKTGFSDLDTDEYEVLENYCLRFGIRGNQWKKEFFKNSQDGEYDLTALNEVRERLVLPLENLKVSIKKDPTYLGISKSVYEFLVECGCGEKTRSLSDELLEQGDLELSAENTQIYNKIIELLDEIAEIFLDKKTNIKDYCDILKSGIEAAELGLLPSSVDEVTVGDVKRTRQNNIEVLFLLGVNEGVLPGAAEKTGLFSSAELEYLERAKNIQLGEDMSYQSVQEKYLFSSLIAKARNKVFFSYPLADFEGGILRPSSYVDRLREIFSDLAIGFDYGEEKDLISNPSGTLRHLISYYRKGIDEYESIDNLWWNGAYRWYANQRDWKDKMDSLKRAMTYANKPSPLTKEQLKKLYGQKIRNSVTGLETFGQCPFKYFVRYGLKPRERRVYEVSMPDIGQLLHDAIKSYGEILDKEGLRWTDVDEDRIIKMCTELVDETTQRYKEGVFLSKGRYKYLAQYLKRLLVRAVMTLTYHMSRGEFDIYKSEIGFGEKQELPPLEFKLNEEMDMILEGRIDRVDVFEDEDKIYLKVIDYKTGEKTLELKEIYYGLSLQLLIYMSACLAKYDNAEPAGVFYFKLDDPLVAGSKKDIKNIGTKINKILKLKGLIRKDPKILYALDKDAGDSEVINCKITKDGKIHANTKGMVEEQVFEMLLDYSVEAAKRMGEKIAAGKIDIEPVKSGAREACLFCDYKNICQFDRKFIGNRMRYKKSLSDKEVIEKLLGGEKDG